MKKSNNTTWKRIAAGTLSLALVAGAESASMIGQYIRTPGRGGSVTMSFPGVSASSPVYVIAILS